MLRQPQRLKRWCDDIAYEKYEIKVFKTWPFTVQRWCMLAVSVGEYRLAMHKSGIWPSVKLFFVFVILFEIRYEEHLSSFRNNPEKSNFAKNLLVNNHYPTFKV